VSLAEFNRRLAMLVVTPEVDAAEREAWQASPDLTERERRRLASIADHGGLETARVIHRFFRANALMEALPLSLQAFGPGEIKPLLAAFWRTHAPTSIYNHSESAAFAAFVLARIEAGELEAPLLADLLRFELAEIELRTGRGGQQTRGREVLAELEDPQRQAPIVRPELRVVAMTYDPGELLARARARQELAGVPRRLGFVLLRAVAMGTVVATQLLAQLGGALVACDGRRSAAAVAAELERPVEELQQLADAGLVAFVELPLAHEA
jgi:hypothetical protein